MTGIRCPDTGSIPDTQRNISSEIMEGSQKERWDFLEGRGNGDDQSLAESKAAETGDR